MGQVSKLELANNARDRILHSAFTVLSRQGYDGTSIKDIAEEADVAQGLVHYHFKSKQQLVLAVLDEVRRVMKLCTAEETYGTQLTSERFRMMLEHNREVSALYIQLIAVGLYDKEVGVGVMNLVTEDRERIEPIARKVLAARDLDPGLARPLASVIEAGVLGIAIQSLIDPNFQVDQAVEAFNVTFRSTPSVS